MEEVIEKEVLVDGEVETVSSEENEVVATEAEKEPRIDPLTGEDRHELTEDEREAIIEDWNNNNKENGFMRKEKPTAEELKEIAEGYNEAVQKYNTRQFELADAPNALRVAEFLKKWNEEDVQWENNMWMGTIMFDSIVRNFIEDYNKNGEKSFMINYGTLTYLYLGMRNIKGRGLKSAIHMQKINDEYMKILDTVGDLYTEHQERAEKLQTMQERWRMAEMGFYTTFYSLEENEGHTEAVIDCGDECNCECDGECECDACCCPPEEEKA